MKWFLRVLVWFVGLFSVALITEIINNEGFALGALPTIALYGVGFYLVRWIDRKLFHKPKN